MLYSMLFLRYIKAHWSWKIVSPFENDSIFKYCFTCDLQLLYKKYIYIFFKLQVFDISVITDASYTKSRFQLTFDCGKYRFLKAVTKHQKPLD